MTNDTLVHYEYALCPESRKYALPASAQPNRPVLFPPHTPPWPKPNVQEGTQHPLTPARRPAPDRPNNQPFFIPQRPVSQGTPALMAQFQGRPKAPLPGAWGGAIFAYGEGEIR